METFYDFIHKDKKQEPAKRTATAEDYIIPASKPRPQRPAQRVNEDEMMSGRWNNPTKPVVPRPQPRPQFVPQAQPVKPQMPKPLNEAYEMINQMKKKMESIFYRYGIIGLERLDEALEDVIEEIMNPQPVYIEREPEPVMEPPKPIKKKKPRRRPTVAKKPLPQVEEEPVVEETQEEFVDTLLNDDTPTNADFANMAANLDLDTLNAVMAKEKKMPKRMTEGEVQRNAKMKQLEAVMVATEEAEAQAEELPPEEDYSDEGIEVVENESEVMNDYEETEQE